MQRVNEQTERPLSTLRQHWNNVQARGLHLGDEREVETADDPRDESSKGRIVSVCGAVDEPKASVAIHRPGPLVGVAVPLE